MEMTANLNLLDHRDLQSIKMLNRAQFYEVASKHGINLYVLGGEKEYLTAELIGMHLKPKDLAPVPGNKQILLIKLKLEISKPVQ